MPVQLYIGLVAEGKTDVRFLKPVIENLFLDLAHAGRSQLQIEDVIAFK